MQTVLGTFMLWLFAAASVFAQPPQWQKVAVGDSVTIEFPGTPTRHEMAEGIAYVQNSEQIALLAVVKRDAFRADATAEELTIFYNNTLAGMLEAGGGGKIISQQSVSLNEFPAVRAQLAMSKNTKIKGLYFNQVVLVNGTCYAQSVVVPGAVTPAVLAAKDRFFASFSALARRTAPGDPSTHSSAYQLGHLTGTLVFYGGIAALAVFLLRRKSKSSKAV